MIPLFDAEAAVADYFGMGYSEHMTDMKIECVRRYFFEPHLARPYRKRYKTYDGSYIGIYGYLLSFI